MPHPTLRQLRMFLEAVETGSVSAAARSLNLTQPAASQQLRELERALGARLLDRAGGRMNPTAAGDALLNPARRALAAVEDAVAAVGAYRAGDVGRVRLGTGATACIYLLPPVLAAVRQRMPGLDVIITTGNTPEILRRVETGRLDAALVTLPAIISRSLSATPLRSDPLVAVVPEAMRSECTDISPAQLAQLPLILYEADGSTRVIVDAWFRRAGLVAQPIMELGNVEAIKVLVASGLGASILPQLALGQAIAGTVSRPLRPAVKRRLGLVLRKEKVIDRALRVFLDEIGRLQNSRPSTT